MQERVGFATTINSSMPLSRRDSLAYIASLMALPWLNAAGRSARAQGSALYTLIDQLNSDISTPDDPLLGTIVQYQRGRAAGLYTAEEITKLAIKRCNDNNSRLHAIDILAPTAIDEARASDARLRSRSMRGALDGVPVFAKSIYDMKGLPTTASSYAWSRLFPDAVSRDALEVERLRSAGAVLLGKTVADDFAYRGNGTSSLSGQVVNPHDPKGSRTPGGSSAGSAVSVACGMAFAALGTDDGGSNRIPAQFTGVVGMKPTFGLVPRTGVIPTWPILDTHGPLARFVADAALMLDAIAGPPPDASDSFALSAPWNRGLLATLNDNALRGSRLGVVEAHVPRAQMSAQSVQVFDRAIADCVRAGAEVEVFTPPVTRASVREQIVAAAKQRGDVVPDDRAPACTANALLRYFAGQTQSIGEAREKVKRGLAAYRAFYDVLPSDWEEMSVLIERPYEKEPATLSFMRSRDQLIAELAQAMHKAHIDALVYPTMPFGAPLASDPWPDVRTTLGYGNALGLPEVSVPAGYDDSGMPIGNLSFVGVPGSDAKLLSLAHSWERFTKRFQPA